MDSELYIISGCNGAGKTTASFTLLPDVLGVDEFVNADEIAAGLSPFNPAKVAMDAGRLMLKRIGDLMAKHKTFAIETTLATRSYAGLIDRAHKLGYVVHLMYIWLASPLEAIQRVAMRVSEGGHNIPRDVIVRRYYRGINNLKNIFMPRVDSWMLIDNSMGRQHVVATNECVIDRSVYDRILNDD
ncbi:MAG: zeta toxin family protein [Duncaniella sp.]|uniref:zeta toxin family protein n=1 Tax=uncultured Duncaniella sp. TaxID=2768039 RepID=UPI0023D1E702|nr:zeta toxin family protein [uncultured Duncaniella sp.]MDE5724895.1 zeta toxin family protein [Duncaniella sp.]MDE5751425.1 zeta toxin family protein [Duncaniella sp.]MDE6327216.1 zeta toxin family protein [Duncaniella sp.]MDE6358452.1 zeta toxin family protein [Duncaniella sp.]MDE6467141.1 zeta toxin family protein [Duncaniella sp.]